ncbi:hypothetical protein CMI48_03895 [Candidatus Pacearchaeota archaeon]|nr:hypothetical protein [Candidatus Pacearchaeota archaeon]|tara:strand:- start:211 stop:990 length:780 start_codon:yes stop_codon:yes gene_type:complete
MFIIFKKDKLNGITKNAIKKAGSIRKLEDITNIPRSTISAYHNEKRAITKENLGKITDYTKQKVNQIDLKESLPQNWRQIKGGKNCVKAKRKNGTFQESLKNCQRASSEKMKAWHEKMKTTQPEKYYKIQYERFKKIAGYKHKTNDGKKVRNKLEKEIADLLNKMKINYQYEPLVKANNKYFFPDFLINKNIIIECTMWKGADKAIKLKEKIKHLKEKYRVYVLIPKALNRYYKILNNHLLLGVDELVPVAQSFRDPKG